MPVDRQAIFQLSLLLLALPAQYFIAKYMSSTESSRNSALQNILTSAASIRNKYFTWQYWQKLCLNLISDVNSGDVSSSGEGEVDSDADRGESPAIEVLKYRRGDGDFATSTDPRSPRPDEVKYRIGQVIKHKHWGYRGIIVGWDPFTKAPSSWIEQMHPKDKPEWKNLPSYSILVDTRDRKDAQKTYVAEANIQLVINTKVIHPDVSDYFEAFDGAQYIPHPWLREIYPHD